MIQPLQITNMDTDDRNLPIVFMKFQPNDKDDNNGHGWCLGALLKNSFDNNNNDYDHECSLQSFRDIVVLSRTKKDIKDFGFIINNLENDHHGEVEIGAINNKDCSTILVESFIEKPNTCSTYIISESTADACEKRQKLSAHIKNFEDKITPPPINNNDNTLKLYIWVHSKNIQTIYDIPCPNCYKQYCSCIRPKIPLKMINSSHIKQCPHESTGVKYQQYIIRVYSTTNVEEFNQMSCIRRVYNE